MSETPAIYEGNKIVEFDPFRAMDRLDDELFLEEMKGRIVDTWAYSFPQDGKTVNGLSKVGVDQACREMAKSGEVIREEDVAYQVDPTDKRYVLFKGFASRVAVAKDGKEVFLDRTVGTKRQCVFIVKKEGITDKVNPFWYEQGAMKALRNARMRLLSEEIKTKIILFAKESKKTREVVPDDDVGGNGNLSGTDLFNSVQVLVEDIATKNNKTTGYYVEYFTAVNTKKDGKWVKEKEGVTDLKDYHGDLNKLYEKVKKYYEKMGSN